MKSCERLVAPQSEYYIYSPSRLAMETFLYPMQCGQFSYLPGYLLSRDSFDSFLLLYIQKGSLEASFDGKSVTAVRGQFVLLDCYRPHGYRTGEGFDCLWCHFDGVMARPYYNAVRARLGNVFSLPDPHSVADKLLAIFRVFQTGSIVREPLLAKYLTDLLTACLLVQTLPENSGRQAGMAEETVTYINENFAKDISVEQLAHRAGLSLYHFIRTFKKETGFTPHEYLVNTRIATARYLLKNTTLSVKDICFQTGFSCESVFCSAFKRRQGLTPAQYRASE
ncbi:MAG: AraC family transcriptional regulator [Eubacteriales bacterium]|nr:AraC family transcriptional regulator [Eubacteriales bacterium]